MTLKTRLASLMEQWHQSSITARPSGPFLALLRDGTSMSHMVAMMILHHAGSASMLQLSKRLGLSTSATSNLVQRMVEQNIVTRVVNARDRRIKSVALTALGRRRADKLQRARLDELERTIELLTPETQRDLVHVLDRVVCEIALHKKKEAL